MPRHLVLSAALLLAGAAAAHAALVERHDVQSLTRAADEVAVVEVVRTTPVRVEGRIITRVEVVPHTVLKGRPGAAFTVEVPGGELDGLGQKVAGAAAFTPGELAVVFTRKQGEARRLVGMAQGKLAVAFGPTGIAFVPDLQGLTTAMRTPQGWQVTPPALSGPIPLAELLTQVSQAVSP
ncbi:MAG: hypothetical protein H6702_01675 [Myxococcales bacterium]|nr:hypothetical protein [Myxococcales bacterium]